jgi:hypothetical protein
MSRIVVKLRDLLVKLWYGDVPLHEGWHVDELQPIVVELEVAQVRLRECGNVTCFERPMRGSIFCWNCMMDDTVECVKFSKEEPSATRLAPLHAIVQALDALRHVTTSRFVSLADMYTVAFDEMLGKVGKHRQKTYAEIVARYPVRQYDEVCA